MEIQLNDIGKRYIHHWIFKGLSGTYTGNKKYGVVGNNGSGKSTFLKVISGYVAVSKGDILYDGVKELAPGKLSFAAPYIELLEEYSMLQLIDFHSRFIPINEDANKIVDIIGLKGHETKPIASFSSGMKQRVKLALAFYSDSDILLLDEPTVNLDDAGIQLYLNLIKTTKPRLTFVASNEERELSICDQRISILDYKVQDAARI